MSYDDPRVEWMRDRVCLGLDVKEEVSLVTLKFKQLIY